MTDSAQRKKGRPATGQGKTLYIPADKVEAVSMLLSDVSKTAGIYAIRNAINEKIYIGSSSDIKKRWLLHRSLLNAGNHPNKSLQKDWNEYGENAFAFSVLEIVSDIEWLSWSEREWVQTFCSSSSNKGYNSRSFVTRGRKNKKEKNLQEIFIEENIAIPPSLKDLWLRQSKQSRGFTWVNGHIAGKHIGTLCQVLRFLENTSKKRELPNEFKEVTQDSSVEMLLREISCYFPSDTNLGA